jgi:hypothetical protein
MEERPPLALPVHRDCYLDEGHALSPDKGRLVNGYALPVRIVNAPRPG